MKALFFLALVSLALAEQRRFDNDIVIQVIPRNSKQLTFLQKLQDDVDLDFWSPPIRKGAKTEIRLSESKFSTLQLALRSAHLKTKTVIENVQKVVDGVRDKSLYSLNLAPTERYAPFNDISTWLGNVAADCGDRCNVMDIGTTSEGRTMKVIKITAPGSTEDKPAVFVDGGIHSREWISPTFVSNVIVKLIDNSETEVGEMLQIYDFYVIPVLNPDGYQYSHDSDRMWRKNRAPTSRRCFGVDLNRNFGYKYGVSGTSSKPCSDLYKGSEAFSELESKALRDFLMQIHPKVYLSFHSYGQYLLFPYGYGREYAPNHIQLLAAGNAAGTAIRLAGGGSWTVGNSAIELYPAAGASDDYAYSIGANYSYTIELPPTDDNIGFLLPESKISQTVTQVWPGIKALMKEIMRETAASQLSGNQDGVDNSEMKGNTWWETFFQNIVIG